MVETHFERLAFHLGAAKLYNAKGASRDNSLSKLVLALRREEVRVWTTKSQEPDREHPAP